MGFATILDPNAAKAAEEAAAGGGNGDFPPLPKGKYQAVIEKIKGVSPFSSKPGYEGKQVVNIGFKIVDDSPTGRGRFVWGRVPLFTRYAPSQEHPEGAAVRAFWDFWEKAIGVPRDYILSGQPLPDNIEGKRLTITLSAPTLPDNYNPLGSNDIDFYDAAGDIALTPKIVPGVPVAPWLDEKGHLKADFQPPQPAAQGGAAPASSFGGAAPQSSFGQAPAQPPASAFAAAAQPAAPAADVWNPAAAGNSALAAAAAASSGF